jgi:hypothetical protein
MANHQKRSSGRQPADTTVAEPQTENGNDAGNDAVAQEGTAAQTPPGAPAGSDAPRPQGKQAPALNINDLKD